MIEQEKMSRVVDVCRFVTTNVMQFCDWEAFYAGQDVLGPPTVRWEWGKQIEGSPFENLDAGCFSFTHGDSTRGSNQKPPFVRAFHKISCMYVCRYILTSVGSAKILRGTNPKDIS